MSPRCSICKRTAQVIVDDGPPICRRCIVDALEMAEGELILRRLFRRIG